MPARYKLLNGGAVADTQLGLNIPNDPRNSDRMRYEEWVKAGNTPDPLDPVPLGLPVPDYGTDVPPPDQLPDAVTQLRAFLTLPTPTNAQVVNALKLTIKGLLYDLRRSS